MADTRTIAGGALLIVGLGVGGYLFSQYQSGKLGNKFVSGVTLSTSPGEPLQPTVQAIADTLAWTNPTGAAVTYGVQGAVVQQNGLIGGHFFTSGPIAAAAYSAFQSGGANAALPYQGSVPDRVLTVTVAAGAKGRATLYAYDAPTPGEAWAFWIVPNPPSGALLVADATGARASALLKPAYSIPLQVS